MFCLYIHTKIYTYIYIHKYLWRSEKGVENLELVEDGCEPPCRCLKVNLSP